MSANCLIAASIVYLCVSHAHAEDEIVMTPDDVGLYRACGLNCLSIVFRLKGIEVPLKTIESRLRPNENGDSSVAELEATARAFGFTPLSVSADMEHLDAIPLPAIVQLSSLSKISKASHYIVVIGVTSRGIVALDAPSPATYIPYNEFRRTWTGIAVTFPSDDTTRSKLLEALQTNQHGAKVLPAIVSLCSMLVIMWYLIHRRMSLSNCGRSRTLTSMVLTFLAVESLAGSIACSKPSHPPIFAMQSPVIDMGNLEIGDNSFDIPFTNAGDLPLTLVHAKSSCSCTVASLPPSSIIGHERAKITGKIQVRSGSGSADIIIQTNEPDVESRIVRLVWFGKLMPVMSPSAVDLTTLRNETIIQNFEISYPGGSMVEKLEYLGAVGLNPNDTISLVSNDPMAIQGNPVLSKVSTAGKAIFSLKMVAPSQLGDSRRIFRVKIRLHGIINEFPMTVQLHVNDGIRAAPSLVSFSGSSQETIRSIERRLVVSADNPFESMMVESKPDYLDIMIQPSSTTTALLRLRIMANVAPGITRAEIALRDSSGRRLVVPLVINYVPTNEK